MKMEIPGSLKREHEELHEALVRATRAGGDTGEAAKEVARALHSHFEKEEAFALPPLGLLSSLAEGKVSSEMAEAMEMTDRLKSELPKMLEEHQAVVATLRRLREAARREQKPEAARFVEALTLHARTEEEVLYPCAILIGEYLKTTFPRAH